MPKPRHCCARIWTRAIALPEYLQYIIKSQLMTTNSLKQYRITYVLTHQKLVSCGKEWYGSVYIGYISCSSHSSTLSLLLSVPRTRVEGCFAELLHQHIKIDLADPRSQVLHSHIQVWSRLCHYALVTANSLSLLVPRERVVDFGSVLFGPDAVLRFDIALGPGCVWDVRDSDIQEVAWSVTADAQLLAISSQVSSSDMGDCSSFAQGRVVL
jgi:hypothetical protein